MSTVMENKNKLKLKKELNRKNSKYKKAFLGQFIYFYNA